jgi:hypothetical protein
MKLIYTAAAMAVSVTAMDYDLPDPPLCVNDCPLFDFVDTGEVDDCAVLSHWSASGCLSDCRLNDHIVLAHINRQFCRRMDTTDGSYGSIGEFMLTDSSIQDAVDSWPSSEETYGAISAWRTELVTDMRECKC